MHGVGVLDAAHDSFAQRRWTDAHAELTAQDAEQPLDAAHLEQLAVTAHCLGKDDESVQAWSRAYTAYLDAGDIERAALAAGWCSFGLLTRGEIVLGSGWLGRARELCEQHELDSPALGFVMGQTAAGVMLGGDPAAALPMFEAAYRYAERFRDPNTLALTRLGRGQCLTNLGRASEGVQLLDQVMVSITTDDLSPVVAGLAFCAGITTCQQLLDVRRAQDWTAALTRWCDEQPDLVPYRGDCLVHRAEILALHGSWPEAYREAERARDWLMSAATNPVLGDAYYRIGELHRLRGEFTDAETAYKNACQRGRDAQPGLGLLRLVQGHVESATAAIRRALEETHEWVPRAALLGAYTEVALAAGDVATARAAAAELASLAAENDVALLRAQALHAGGAVDVAEGDARAALIPLRAAWKLWQEVEAPYEEARTRVMIAQACRALGDEDTAELELDAACWIFQELGAAPDLARAQGLSSRPAVAPARRLTLREVQVLRLVSGGKTNKAIAAELFLSEKTVHRHLSNIFAKLDVSSRSAATAYAFQHGLA